MTDGQRPLRELEKRLEKEPDNLSLRVTVAGMLSEAGRKAEAVEHYRSVALAYREQGRSQQAIAVCRSILELAPDDIAIHALVTELTKAGRAASADPYPATAPGTSPPSGATGTGERRTRTPSAGEPTRTGSRPPPGIDEPEVGADRPRTATGSATGSQRMVPIKVTPTPVEGTPQHPQPPKTKSQPPASAAALITRPLVPSPAGAKTPSRPPAVRTPPAAVPTVKPGSIPGIPRRTVSGGELDTPLPKAVPYHVADPTSSPMKIPLDDTEDEPPHEDGVATKPGGDPEERPDLTGLAQAARRISGLIAQDQLPPARNEVDLLVELDTRQVPRLSAAELEKVSQPPPTVPVDKVDEDDLHDLPTPIPPPSPKAERAWRRPTTSPAVPIRDTPIDPPTDLNNIGPRDGDDELTSPRELQTADPLANAFFVALPANRREAALARCLKKSVRAGATVIRQGETSHPLILVVSGKLELRIERANGTLAILDTIDTGQYIGEAALLGRTPASANVIAMVDCELLALPPHALFELAGAYPALWAALKDTAERRTRQYEKVIRASP